eukprot:TRINITY_DN47055_c0_g1_i1.p1 TRINITY_DN47055_c0_g1~~TRINITY_DN47055_c0_g1_i1.p1  ORF type:complete len:462 (+),score=185.73 TRINITY_DN47055_c0_g1_i1:88-1473(+)
MSRQVLRATARRGYCTHAYNYTAASLSEPYIMEVPKRNPVGATAATSSVHKNGMRVITKDNGGAASSVAFWVDAGAIYEQADNAGVSDAVTEMLYKSNLISSDYHMFKTFQHCAANYSTGQVGKRWIGMKLDCRRDLVGPLMQRLCEAMFVPRFAGHELTNVREKLESKAATADHDAASYLTEQTAATAFQGSALANSSTVPEYNVDKLTSTDLVNWWAQHFVPQRILLCGVNVSNEELSGAFDAAEWSGCGVENPSHAGLELLPVSPQQGMYVGGQYRQFVRITDKFSRQKWYNDVHVVYARRGFGRHNTKDYAASLVAAALLGPCTAACGTSGFVQSFDSIGLVGGRVRARPDDAGALVKAMAAEVNAVGSASGEKLAAARKVAAVGFLNSVESREGLLDFFALHSNPCGLAVQPEDVAAAIHAVTEADLKRVSDFMQAAPPTLACYGDLSTVPALQNL